MVANWRDWSANPDSNVMAQPIGAPEGGFKGPWVNNIMRNMMSAIYNLGASTLKLPALPNVGFPEGAESKAGTMALQDKASVTITGGNITNCSGVVPIRGLIPFSGTLVQAAATSPYGWAICDGRTQNFITTPDLRGIFIKGAAAAANAGGTGGASAGTATTSSAAAHTHTASASTAPAHSHGTLSGGLHYTGQANASGSGGTGFSNTGPDPLVHRHTIDDGGSHTHTVTVTSGGAHTHTVAVDPAFYTVIWLMRVA